MIQSRRQKCNTSPTLLLNNYLKPLLCLEPIAESSCFVSDMPSILPQRVRVKKYQAKRERRLKKKRNSLFESCGAIQCVEFKGKLELRGEKLMCFAIFLLPTELESGVGTVLPLFLVERGHWLL